MGLMLYSYKTMYRIAGNTDGSAFTKISKNRKNLNVRTTCGLNTEKARKLKPRKFLLEVILEKVQIFTLAKIFRYTVLYSYR